MDNKDDDGEAVETESWEQFAARLSGFKEKTQAEREQHRRDFDAMHADLRRVRPRVRTRRRVIEESESESDDAEDAEAAEAESEDAEAESEALVLPPRWWAPPREELRESEAVELFITF